MLELPKNERSKNYLIIITKLEVIRNYTNDHFSFGKFHVKVKIASAMIFMYLISKELRETISEQTWSFLPLNFTEMFHTPRSKHVSHQKGFTSAEMIAPIVSKYVLHFL